MRARISQEVRAKVEASIQTAETAIQTAAPDPETETHVRQCVRDLDLGALLKIMDTE